MASSAPMTHYAGKGRDMKKKMSFKETVRIRANNEKAYLEGASTAETGKKGTLISRMRVRGKDGKERPISDELQAALAEQYEREKKRKKKQSAMSKQVKR